MVIPIIIPDGELYNVVSLLYSLGDKVNDDGSYDRDKYLPAKVVHPRPCVRLAAWDRSGGWTRLTCCGTCRDHDLILTGGDVGTTACFIAFLSIVSGWYSILARSTSTGPHACLVLPWSVGTLRAGRVAEEGGGGVADSGKHCGGFGLAPQFQAGP
jgi:hypothetical protein